MRQLVTLLQKLGTPTVAVFCLFVAGALQLQQLNELRGQSTGLASLKDQLEQEKLGLELIQKAPTFGFNNLVADWVFLNFLQYFGDEPARSRTGYRLSSDYFKVIVDRDPKFLNIYPFLSTSISMFAAMPEQSVALIQKGLKSLDPKVPAKSYYVWRYKGIDELLFLGDSKAARYSFETAASWANVYSDPESQNVAAISQRTAQFLAGNPASKAAQVSAWMMVLGNAVDNRTRHLAINRIQSLGGKVFISPQGQVRIVAPKQD